MNRLGMCLSVMLVAAQAVCAWGADAAPGRSQSASRSLFVIGAPGRLDDIDDLRHPRRYLRDQSDIAAYVDVEQVSDPTWLRHEVLAYVRRTLDCAGVTPPWCRREVRRIGTVRAIYLAVGTEAELVWYSKRGLAVRLRWRRIVATASGTMTVDLPPDPFAQTLLHEIPSQVEMSELGDAGSEAWKVSEVERLLYYAEQVATAMTDDVPEAHRRHAAQFVEENLARVALLRAELDGGATGIADDPAPHQSAASATEPSLDLADRLARAQRWNHRSEPLECAVPTANSTLINLAGR